MSAHTQGEWLAHVDAAHHRVVVRVGLTPIAEMWMTGQPQAEREANARLIAAAPDLLAFAVAFVELFNGDPDSPIDQSQLEQARAAIAKATGGGA